MISLSLFLCFDCVLRLQVFTSVIRSWIWSEVQLCLLHTSLVCFKYFPHVNLCPPNSVNFLLCSLSSKYKLLLINLYWLSASVFHHYYECTFLNIGFFLIVIYYMQGWTATTRHGVTRKRSIKRSKHTVNLFTKNLQLIVVF